VVTQKPTETDWLRWATIYSLRPLFAQKLASERRCWLLDALLGES
jgi:hypothetical protein